MAQSGVCIGNGGLAIVQIAKAIRTQARIQKKLQSITLSLYVLVLIVRDYGPKVKRGMQYAGEALRGVAALKYNIEDFAQILDDNGNIVGVDALPNRGSGPVAPLKATTYDSLPSSLFHFTLILSNVAPVFLTH